MDVAILALYSSFCLSALVLMKVEKLRMRSRAQQMKYRDSLLLVDEHHTIGLLLSYSLSSQEVGHLIQEKGIRGRRRQIEVQRVV